MTWLGRLKLVLVPGTWTRQNELELPAKKHQLLEDVDLTLADRNMQPSHLSYSPFLVQGIKRPGLC